MFNQFTITFKRWKDNSDNHYFFQINSHVALKIDETQTKVTGIHVHNIKCLSYATELPTDMGHTQKTMVSNTKETHLAPLLKTHVCIYYVQKSPDLY